MGTAIHPRSLCRRDPVRFRPAQVAISRGAFAALELADCRARYLVNRHIRADWGLLRDDDARENDWALTHRGAVRSIFELPTGAPVLVATNSARSLTCLLLADAEPPLPGEWLFEGGGHAAPAFAPASTNPPPVPALRTASEPISAPACHGPASIADILPAGPLLAAVLAEESLQTHVTQA